jgi:prepilin-type N-terminal cleavage/methylation domain-containing protein/prepilin-type processing-associated H-X9-DG protein
MRESRKRAMSLIEVLVVLAIVALLAALLLPAIQAAREMSRRSSCANKMRQVGLAMHLYLDANNAFPGWVFGEENGGPWDFHVLLLRSLGQGALYNSLNLSLHWQDAANTTVTFQSPNVYLCPSDSSPRNQAFGFTNYQASLGSGIHPGGFDFEIGPDDRAGGDGVFGFLGDQVPDGLTNTAAVSEQVHGADFENADLQQLRGPTIGLTYIFQVSPATQRNLLTLCEQIGPSTAMVPSPSGIRWPISRGYTHLLTPNMPSCFGGNIGDLHSPLSANSRHKGGVNVLLADGHVRFVTQSIDLEIWRALGSRSGGEQTNAF